MITMRAGNVLFPKTANVDLPPFVNPGSIIGLSWIESDNYWKIPMRDWK